MVFRPPTTQPKQIGAAMLRTDIATANDSIGESL
jgi:hypothetical protein